MCRVGFSPPGICSVNPITTRGADYDHPITASPPGFEDSAASPRNMLFRKLYPSLLKNRRLVRDCITQSFGNKLGENDRLGIMPLLEFCIENFDSFIHHMHESKTVDDEKLKMTEYRRSLLITNYFKNAYFR